MSRRSITGSKREAPGCALSLVGLVLLGFLGLFAAALYGIQQPPCLWSDKTCSGFVSELPNKDFMCERHRDMLYRAADDADKLRIKTYPVSQDHGR